MEPSVRYVKIEEMEGPARWANRVGLCIPQEGDKVICIVQDGNRVRHIKVRERDYLFYRKVPFNGQPYPVDRFIDKLIEISKHRPVTRTVRGFIAGIAPEKADELQLVLEGEEGTYQRGMLIERIAEEFKLIPRKARKLLRAEGLNAPYLDETLIRRILRSAIKKRKIADKANQS